MIAYVCKYTPIEIIKAFDEPIERIIPMESSFEQADTLLHPNICAYSKGILEAYLKGNYNGIILTTCCDSIRRLYDVLKKQFPNDFIYLLDLPHKNTPSACKLFEMRLRDLIIAYQTFSSKSFNIDTLLASLQNSAHAQSSFQKQINIGIIGAGYNASFKKLINHNKLHVQCDFTCTGLSRSFNIVTSNAVLYDYSQALLSQFPCMRMTSTDVRFSNLQKQLTSLDGLIYHTVKFCDHYAYEYAFLKNTLDLPILKLETDYSTQCEGQIQTRLGAFSENLKKRKASSTCTNCFTQKQELHQHYHQMKTTLYKEKQLIKSKGVINMKQSTLPKGTFILGIDSGSTSTNAVILDENQKLIAYYVIRTGAKSSDSAQKALDTILEKAHLTLDDLATVVATGYGRISIPFAQMNITEISCHGKGAHYLNPKVRTIIDIGGQDSKAIHLNEQGDVIDFVMNDKCAAGTGRFLEMMARTLEISLSEMGPESLKSQEEILISNMCSVFAESEVISLIAQNKNKCDIIQGINKGIANKSFALLSRVGKEGAFMMTGGVAKNIGVVKAIEHKIGDKLFIPSEPEIVGALGAALLGLESLAQ